MPELLADVRDRSARLQQQRRVRVTKIVNPNLSQIRLFEQPAENSPDVPFFERRALERREWPQTRIYRKSPMVYFIYFDANEVIRDFSCLVSYPCIFRADTDHRQA